MSVKVMEPIGNHLMYENKDYGFRFKFPGDWTVNENPNVFVILHPPEKNMMELAKKNIVSFSTDDSIDSTFNTNLNFTFRNLISQPISLDMFIEHSLNQIESFFEEFKLLSAENTQLSAKPAKKLVYTGKVQGRYHVQFLQYSTMNNFKAHVLTYAADKKNYLSYLEEVNDIISSFEII